MKVSNYRKQARSGWQILSIDEIKDLTDEVNEKVASDNEKNGTTKDDWNAVWEIVFSGDGGEVINSRLYGRYGLYNGRPTAGTMRQFADLASAAGVPVVDEEFDEDDIPGNRIKARIYKDDRGFHRVYSRFAPVDAPIETIEELEDVFKKDVKNGYVRLWAGGDSE